MTGPTRFVRIRGRVVPISAKESASRVAGYNHALKVGALAGATAIGATIAHYNDKARLASAFAAGTSGLATYLAVHSIIQGARDKKAPIRTAAYTYAHGVLGGAVAGAVGGVAGGMVIRGGDALAKWKRARRIAKSGLKLV